MNRIFADTNVLFPFSVMDLLLALSEDGLHELIWTELFSTNGKTSSSENTSGRRRRPSTQTR